MGRGGISFELESSMFVCWSNGRKMRETEYSLLYSKKMLHTGRLESTIRLSIGSWAVGATYPVRLIDLWVEAPTVPLSYPTVPY